MDDVLAGLVKDGFPNCLKMHAGTFAVQLQIRLQLVCCTGDYLLTQCQTANQHRKTDSQSLSQTASIFSSSPAIWILNVSQPSNSSSATPNCCGA